MPTNFLCRVILLGGILLWIITTPSHAPVVTISAILIHECGHLLATRLCHIKTNGFCVDTLGARLALSRATLSYPKELIICAAGPFANVLSILPLYTFRSNVDISFFISVSLALALLNLLPVKGFDGGRIFYCLLSLVLPPSAAERLYSLSSFFCLFILWCGSVYMMIRTGADISLFVFSAGIFTRVFLLGKMP